MRLVMFRGKWSVTWHSVTGTQRRSLGTVDRQVAEQRFAEFQHKQNQQSAVTIEGLMKVYLEEKKDRSSYKTMEAHAIPIRRELGDSPPSAITRAVCRKYIAKRREAVKDGTILKELSQLRAAVKFVSPNCGAIFELPGSPPPRDRHLTREEYAKLCEAAKGTPHIWLFIVLALNTGARMTALLELTWSRVDFKRGLITLATHERTRMKGRATVAMNASARSALENAYKMRITDYVIEYGANKKPLGSVKRGFSNAVEAAGLSDVTPHVMRHTAAVWMAEKAIPMMQIAQFLGHSDSRLTERVYARFSPDFLRHAANALEENGSNEQSTIA